MKQVSLVTILFSLSVVAHAENAALSKSVASQIEGPTAKQLELGSLTAKCPTAPASPKDGDTFLCTAKSQDGSEYRFEAKITKDADAKTHVSLTLTNLLTAETMTALITKVLPSLSQQTKETIEAKDVECPKAYAIKNPDDMKIPCTVITPSDKKRHATEIHVTKELISADIKDATKEED